MADPTAPLHSNLRVMIATPNRELATAVGEMLHGLLIRTVRKAHDSAELYRILSITPLDALILDNAIGPDDGITIAKRLRTRENCPNRTLPIVMISGATDRKNIEAARDAGIHEFVRMPASADILGTRLRSALCAPREFVVAPAYAGPDRRRRSETIAGPERRAPRT